MEEISDKDMIDILVRVPSLELLLDKINIRVNQLINTIFYSYIDMFNRIEPHWNIRTGRLIELLFKNNDINALYFLINNFDTNKTLFARYAIIYNNIEFLIFALNVGADDINELIATAVFYNNTEIFKFLETKTKDIDYNNIARIAIVNGNYEIFKLIAKHINGNITQFVTYMIKYRRLNMLEFLAENHKLDYTNIASKALSENNMEIFKWATNRIIK